MKSRPALARRYPVSSGWSGLLCEEEATVEALAKEAGLSITDAWSDRPSIVRVKGYAFGAQIIRVLRAGRALSTGRSTLAVYLKTSSIRF
jgi:hypothetical protein